MNRHFRRAGTSGLGLAIAAALVATTNVVGASPWTTPVTVATAQYPNLDGAAFSGNNVAVIWNVRKHGMFVRTSRDSGASFASVTRFSDAEDLGGAVTLCGDEVDVVYVRHLPSGDWALERAVGSAGHSAFTTTPISVGPETRSFPDVACSDGRLFVTWAQVEDGKLDLLFSSARLADGVFNAPISLGLDNSTYYPDTLVVTSSAGMAYVAYALGDGYLWLKRWRIGPGPADALSSRPKLAIATGTVHHRPLNAVLAADGSTLAASWEKCFGVKAKVSADRGRIWGPTAAVVHYPCTAIVEGGSSPIEIAAHDGSVALVYDSYGIPNFDAQYLRTSADNFTASLTLGNHQQHSVGYLDVAGVTRLADVYSSNRQVRFRIEVSA